MRTVVVSWTNTISSLLKGEITIDDLQDVEFHFSCAREHVLSDKRLPFEVTWSNDNRKTKVDYEKCTIEDVDPDKRDKTLALIELIRTADAEGRVFWRLGNQLEFFESLPKETPVIYKGMKTTAGYFNV